MSIDRCRWRYWLLGLLLATGLAPAEEGQYRSRILLVPPGEIGRGSGLSIEELEQQIDSIEQPYARASAEQHLARHYAVAGDYERAIGHYRQALAADGLSAVANREIQRELARVYLATERYRDAAAALEAALGPGLQPEAGDLLLLARAQHHLGNHVAVVDTLARVEAAGLVLDRQQMEQALALYYRAGAYPQAETLLRRLLELAPGEARYWHQLTAVLLQQDRQRQALDQLALARRKGIPFSPRHIELLADLHAAQGDPFGGARVLEGALSAGELTASAPLYRKLFDLWFLARERDRARAALVQAARLGGDTELYLYLAQLQMEEEDWPAMRETLQAACKEPLEARFVSRANLLLGISLLQQGDDAAARRAFINATLVGGAGAEAAEWLLYMQAAPASDAESRRIEGLCRGPGDSGG